MPKVVISSTTRQKDSIFLLPWVEKKVRPHFTRSHEKSTIFLPVFNFIPKLSSKDLRTLQLSPRILRNPSHFVKIVKFHRVNRYRVFATARDSTFRILS